MPIDDSETTASMRYHHCLGLKPSKGQSLDFIGSDSLMYLSGMHVASYNLETASHKFILKSAKTKEIICFCVSANRKYIALAELLPEGMQVNIYTESTGSKVRCLEFKFLSKLPVVSMCFSSDNKYLVTATAVPDAFIYLWQVDKSRLVGMMNVPYEIANVTISPWGYWSLCSTGPTSLRMWRLVDKQLKATDPIPKRQDGTHLSLRFTSHCWYDDEKVAACTEEGHVVIVENGEVKRVINSIHGEGFGLSRILSIGRGLVVGGDGGVVSVLSRVADGATYFQSFRQFSVLSDSRVLELAVSPKEETLAIAYGDNTIGTVSLDLLDIQRDRAHLEPIRTPIGFHSAPVTCIDLCTQKAFVVTGSVDRMLRVWNFMRRRIEFTHTFDEEILSLALHPSGLRLLVGFRSGLRMYNMLAEGIHPCTEFPVKPCNQVHFSTGGQMFAAVVAHRVLIFNSYDFTCVAQLSGHTVMIRSMSWSSNDQYLTTADLNGVAYTWQISNQERIDTDDVRKGVSYSTVLYDAITDSVAIYGISRASEGSLAEGEVSIRCLLPNREPHIARPGILSPTQLSQRKFHTTEMALSGSAKTLFVGLPNGCLALYRYPLADDAQPYARYEVHDGEIHHVALSPDEQFLFTVGEDRVMYMFGIDALCEGRAVGRKAFNYAAFDEVCYMLQSEVQEKTGERKLLQQELETLQATKERSEVLLRQRFDEEIDAQQKGAEDRIASLKEELGQSKAKLASVTQAMSENSRSMETMHLRAAEELEALYTRRSEESSAKYNQLRMERDDMIVRYENKLFKLQKEQESDRLRLEEKAKDSEAKFVSEIDLLKERISEEKDVHDAMLDQAILDYEMMIDEAKDDHRSLLEQKDEELGKAINLSSTGERDTERLKRDKENLLDQLRERDLKVTDLELLAEKRKRENEAQKKEMAVRFESISVAEKKIQQLKKQATELEKLRYVLTFKFNELKKEVAPKEKQIEFMTQRVEEMDEELEKVTTDREHLKRNLDHRDDKLRAVQTEIVKQRRNISDKERSVESLLREVTEAVNGCREPKNLIYRVKDILVRYDTKDGRNEAVKDDNKVAEFERQRAYMEAQLTGVKRQTVQKEVGLRLDNQRNTSENAILVKEINELRQEKKLLGSKCQLVEQQLKDARTALQRATAATEASKGAASSRAVQRDVGGDSTALALPGRGRLIRGPTRALRDVAHLDSDKIARIISQVERNNGEMEKQQEEILRLREFVKHLLARSDLNADTYSPEERQRQEEMRAALAADGVLL